jgi:ureidoacrylate peracid hydrolase
MNTAFYQQQGDELREGSEGHELLAELENDKDDLVVNKYRFSALCPGSSELAEMLLKLGIRSLIVAGGPTNTCCDSTARDAMMLGYKVVVAADATIAEAEMDHQGSLRTLGTYFCDVRTTTETAALILSGGGARM